MLFVVKSSQYAHSTEDTTQRVVNMLELPQDMPAAVATATSTGLLYSLPLVALLASGIIRSISPSSAPAIALAPANAPAPVSFNHSSVSNICC